jgi:Fur family ferric uptake transcriptional regulator
MPADAGPGTRSGTGGTTYPDAMVAADPQTPGLSPPTVADDLDGALRARGLRATLQRRLVHEAVVELGHGTPEQVCEQVRTVAPSLSPSTVYRTLELLEELGVVSHTHLGHGAPTYHAATHADHLHLVCRRCGAVQEASAAAARQLAAELSGRYGFRADLTHLSVDGVCRGCAATDHGDGEAPGPAGR